MTQIPGKYLTAVVQLWQSRSEDRMILAGVVLAWYQRVTAVMGKYFYLRI